MGSQCFISLWCYTCKALTGPLKLKQSIAKRSLTVYICVCPYLIPPCGFTLSRFCRMSLTQLNKFGWPIDRPLEANNWCLSWFCTAEEMHWVYVVWHRFSGQQCLEGCKHWCLHASVNISEFRLPNSSWPLCNTLDPPSHGLWWSSKLGKHKHFTIQCWLWTHHITTSDTEPKLSLTGFVVDIFCGFYVCTNTVKSKELIMNLIFAVFFLSVKSH